MDEMDNEEPQPERQARRHKARRARVRVLERAHELRKRRMTAAAERDLAHIGGFHKVVRRSKTP